jgi:hypothetical protein
MSPSRNSSLYEGLNSKKGTKDLYLDTIWGAFASATGSRPDFVVLRSDLSSLEVFIH